MEKPGSGINIRDPQHWYIRYKFDRSQVRELINSLVGDLEASVSFRLVPKPGSATFEKMLNTSVVRYSQLYQTQPSDTLKTVLIRIKMDPDP
jgi:hypothetical protein